MFFEHPPPSRLKPNLVSYRSCVRADASQKDSTEETGKQKMRDRAKLPGKEKAIRRASQCATRAASYRATHAASNSKASLPKGGPGNRYPIQNKLPMDTFSAPYFTRSYRGLAHRIFRGCLLSCGARAQDDDHAEGLQHSALHQIST